MNLPIDSALVAQIEAEKNDALRRYWAAAIYDFERCPSWRVFRLLRLARLVRSLSRESTAATKVANG